MDRSLKWIGGATAAVLLLFGAVTLAAKLFAITSTGDKVIITRGKMVGMGDSLISG